jgi:hypothetical protein
MYEEKLKKDPNEKGSLGNEPFGSLFVVIDRVYTNVVCGSI